MKRSEMLAIIYDAFFDCLDIPNESFVTNKKFDEYILDKIEKAGMIPPEAADFNIGNNWEPEEPRVEELNKIGKRISNQIDAELLKSRDTLVEQCYDILKEYEIPYGKSVVEQVNAEIKKLNGLNATMIIYDEAADIKDLMNAMSKNS